MSVVLEQPRPPTPLGSRPLARAWSALRFLAATAFWLLVLELILRQTFPRHDAFWHAVDASPPATPTNILFIGSSRVAAAVDAYTFFYALPPDRQNLRIVNAGVGYSTPAEFYLALRNTLQSDPAKLEHATLFIEAPGGMPDPQTWDDPWPHPDRPEFLTPLLQTSDLLRHWQTPASLEDKLQLSADFLLRPWMTFSRRHTIGPFLRDSTEHALTSALERLLPCPSVLSPQSSVLSTQHSGLTSAAGIRTDAPGILLARRIAHDYAQTMMRDQRPVEWNRTIIADLVRLAQNARIQVIFFTPPLHSLHQAIYDTPARREDRARFAAQAVLWHTPLLIPDFPVADDDFPDIWHLRQSRSPGYTQALLSAWQSAGQRP